MSTSTAIIHSIPVDELTGAISVPIYQTSTFVQEAPGVHKGFDYARTNNPTRAVLENVIAQLEEGSVGVAFASGLAAIDAVVKLLSSGDEILAVDDIYGGAFRLFTHIYEKFGIKVTYVDATKVENVFNAMSKKVKLIWIETPTNPTLKIADIQAIAKVAKAYDAYLCVDNTFATPAFQKPLTLGADIIVHSGTKYLGGHSDLISGLVVTSNKELGEKIKFIQNASGAILGPFDSWLLIRGIETLNVRMKVHCENAKDVVEALLLHPLVNKVYYPGLHEHTNHVTARKQCKSFGAIISFTLKEDTAEAAKTFVTSTKLFKLAESLGGVKSLCCHPATMTHKSIPEEKRKAAGVADSLIRLSIGLEESEDLVKDIQHALLAVDKKSAVQQFGKSL
jgi:cysteine-S-conjugate beta-lyase